MSELFKFYATPFEGNWRHLQVPGSVFIYLRLRINQDRMGLKRLFTEHLLGYRLVFIFLKFVEK